MLLSGGLASTIALAEEVARGGEVRALCLDWGQRARGEIDAAWRVSEALAVPMLVSAVPVWEGLTESLEGPPPGLVATLGTVGLTYAAMAGAGAMVLGAASLATAGALDTLGALPSYGRGGVRVTAGASETAAEFVLQGALLGAPLSDTWSCAEPGRVHCGRCPPCERRRAAFEGAEVTDRTAYRSQRGQRKRRRSPS